ncbi:UNVERIFIED_CONTAM: hypothetical protein Sangu_3054000 [Sesamum angustifolium]|uniref:Uncharacterized protein n=1 Tax=Sesamum angustifolium TaxID=2727405 RepID=A0AAW2KGT3_9LAMI
MRHEIKLSKKQSPKIYEEPKRMLDIHYASAMGSIQYQACAREAKCRLHFKSDKHISGMCWGGILERGQDHTKYLRRTKDMFLIYSGGEFILEGYCDASFQSDDDGAKSQSGFIFKLNGGVVAWKSSK